MLLLLSADPASACASTWHGCRPTVQRRCCIQMQHGGGLRAHGLGTLTRRQVLSGATASSSLLLPQHLRAATLEDAGFLDSVLRSSSIYAVNVDSTRAASPSARRLSVDRLVRALASQRAIFLGEHHPALRDHLLQAALLRRLCTGQRPVAVGLEAVQRQFQPVLDEYIAGTIGEDELFVATDWARRWYWSFDACAGLGLDPTASELDCPLPTTTCPCPCRSPRGRPI